MGDQDEHTGGMIALLPSAPDAQRLLVDHDDADPLGELHLTLGYLGDDVTGWTPDQRETVLAAVARAAGQRAPAQARVMGHSVFNPNGDGDHDPATVYLVQGHDVSALRDELAEHDRSDHPSFLPHVTSGYGVPVEALTYSGPVTFDRLRVALGGEHHDFPLTGVAVDEPGDPDPEDTETKGNAVTVPGGIEEKAKVASKEGEQRYGKPIGTELGGPRDQNAAKAQDNARARDQYDTLVNGNPADYRKMLDDLGDDDLTALSAITYSFRSSNPKVVSARLALAAALRRRGMDVNDHGGLGRRGGAAGGGKGKATGRSKGSSGKSKGKAASVNARGVGADEVSSKEWARLRAAGWKGDPTDKSERLYPPTGKAKKSAEDELVLDYSDGGTDGVEGKARTTTKPWEKRKAQRGGKTIGAEKSDEKDGGDEWPVKTIGDIAAGVKRAKKIKDADRRKEVMAHLRAGAKKIGGPAVNMVPKDDAGAKGIELDLDDYDVFELAALIERKVMSADPRAAKLREYWAHGKGRAQWRPGTPGDFDRLRRAVRKYIPEHMLNGWVANVHKLATGTWPGAGRGHGGKSADLGEVETKGAGGTGDGLVTLDKADVESAESLMAESDVMSDDDATTLALDRYSQMADEISSMDAYEAALAADVDWTLNADGTIEPDPDSEADRAQRMAALGRAELAEGEQVELDPVGALESLFA